MVAMTTSPYAYVSGNPLNAGDPSGLCGLWGDDVCGWVAPLVAAIVVVAAIGCVIVSDGVCAAVVGDAILNAVGAIGGGGATWALVGGGTFTAGAAVSAETIGTAALGTVALGAAAWGSNCAFAKSSGGFEKMPQGDNQAANRTARAAQRAAERATGKTLTRGEAHDIVSGQGYTTYQEMYDAFIRALTGQ
jgi:hypothetical protein